MGIKERYGAVRQALDEQCRLVGRDPATVSLVAVSKTVGSDEVGEALLAGAQNFGENRPDALVSKAEVYPQATWHFIGNIQSRRIPDIVAHASLIHSLFQESHARRIDAAAAALGKTQEVLLEVNVSGEQSKGGVPPWEVGELLALCNSLPHVRVRGLMTMAPRGDKLLAAQVFSELAQLKQRLCTQLEPQAAALFDGLSMGMSEDWREAVAAGATIVRIGRAVFSEDF